MYTEAKRELISGVEWAGGADDPAHEVEQDTRGWPILCPNEPCDGANPMTGLTCVVGHHQGYHRDVTGARWLDDE